MLELNKEYTYKQMCEILRWKVSAGNSKKAQINEIESAYEFYHPINKKTHKEKKSYIFTAQKHDLVEPSKSNCGGVRNTKVIQPMIDYLRMMGMDDADGIYRSITTWLCDVLGLMIRDTYNIPYMEQVEIKSFCEKYHISNIKLFCDYVSTAKSILKKMFLRALAAMKKQGQVEYEDGFMFTYELGEVSLGHFCTDELNDIIKKNETRICDEMNEKYKLSSKMSGRQLLLLIYHNEAYTNEFNDKKVLALMEDQSALTIMDKCIDGIESDVGTYCGRTYIDDEHPLLSYYRGIAIEAIDDLQDMKVTGTDICSTVRIKARQEILNKHYKNKHGRMVYPYDKFECAGDIKKTEKLLFTFYDENLVDDTALDFVEVDEELEALFGQKEKEIWGAPEPNADAEEIERILG